MYMTEEQRELYNYADDFIKPVPFSLKKCWAGDYILLPSSFVSRCNKKNTRIII